jgi:AcrR family transcriptional regulator
VSLFEEQGYDETTYDDVARRAGVSRSTVYRYFPDKDELPFARDVEHLARLQHLLRASADRLGDREALHRVILAFARSLEQDETLVRRARLIGHDARLFNRVLVIRQSWEGLVARELAGGRAPRLEHCVVAATVVGALFTAVGEWQDAGGRLVPLVRKALGYTLTPG